MDGGPLVTGDACPVHDPTITLGNTTETFIFSTDSVRAPPYLLQRCAPAQSGPWRVCGSVFPSKLPSWLTAAVPGVGPLWAPDVIYSPASSQWYLYYAASTFGSQLSAIGLVTSPTLAAGTMWADAGPVITSSNTTTPFNAIDPSPFFDASGSLWLTWGSFWQGIYIAPVDAVTGKLVAGVPSVNIAGGDPNGDALEGSSVFSFAGAYWLFVSTGRCCDGAASTYVVRAGRADAPTGPYLDKSGMPMLSGGGTRLLGFGGSDFGWPAGGGQTVLRGSGNGTTARMVLHGYDSGNGSPYTNIVTLRFIDGWVQVGA